MLVSIVVPVYNMEEYLPQCIGSILAQSYGNIEVVCVNDCSTDSSLSILHEFEKNDARVKVVDLKVNLRQGGARNVGIEHSSGDYIYFVDSDDWVESELIETLISKSTGCPSEIIYCNYTTRHNDPSLDKIICRNNVDWENDKVDVIKKKLILAPSPIWTALYSSDFFRSKKIRFPEQVFYEDNFIVPILVCHAESISKINLSLINYNMKNSSVTRTFNNDKFFERIVTAKMLLEEISENRFYDKYRSELEFYITEIYLVNTTIGCYRKFYPVRDNRAGEIIEDFRKLLPEFEKNEYFNDKKKRKFFYRMYFFMLMNTRSLVKLIYNVRNKIHLHNK
ncbi:Glycosyltransferase involved in cell wall biosynthesis [Vibrio chagasii]|nr:Glycosyltransferase involved in cell wall biosynthesis [Vibrio chagasii]